MRLGRFELGDELTQEMVTASDEPYTNHLFLKVEPKYRADDKGIYMVHVRLLKGYRWKLSPRTRFHFHLEGSTIRLPCLSSPAPGVKASWTQPARSDRVDIDRTPEMAAEILQVLKQ